MERVVEELWHKDQVVRVVLDLFAHTDARDWAKAKACFTSHVHFDMSSLSGGKPAQLSPAQITEGWDEGLRRLEAIHHQIGNLRVDLIDGGRAVVRCHGTATHFLPDPAGDTRTFIGTYELGLREDADGWRIDRFVYRSRLVKGNLDLGEST